MILRRFVLVSMAVWLTAGVYGDTTSIYSTSVNGFKGWKMKNMYKDQNFSTTNLNQTRQIDLARSNFNQSNAGIFMTFLFSPIVKVAPAYELEYEVLMQVNGVPANTTHVRASYGISNTNRTASSIFSSWKEEGLVRSGLKVRVSVENSNGDRYDYFRFQIQIIWENTNIQRVNLTQFTVTYKNCPSVVYNLVRYSNTVAAREKDVPVINPGVCVENADRPLHSRGRDLFRYCDKEARTQFFDECLCKPGFEVTNNSTECKMCRGGNYQPLMSRHQKCLSCGKRSEDVNNIKCRCIENTYRFKHQVRNSSADCYEFPRSPLNVRVTHSTNSSLAFIWNEPVQKGSLNDLTYSTQCVKPELACLMSRNKDHQGRPTNETLLDLSKQIPRNNMYIAEKMKTFEKLLAFTEYTFQLCTHNEVTITNKYRGTNCMEVKAITKVGYPTKVRDFHVAETRAEKEIVSFGWKRPLSRGSTHLEYFIKCPHNNVTKKSNGNIFEFTTVEIKPLGEDIRCSITPLAKHNGKVYHGPSDVISFKYQPSRLHKNEGDSIVWIVVGGCLAGVLLFIICVVLFVRFASVNRRQKDQLYSLASQLQHERRELEDFARTASRNFRLNQKNMYVPLHVLLNQPVLEGHAPDYKEKPTGYEYDYRNLTIKQALGEGNFAIVYQAEAKNICGHVGSSMVAVKELKRDCSITDIEDFESEVELMMELAHHENIVKLLGIARNPNKCMIVEYLPGGDLLTFLLKSRQYRDSTTEGSFFTADDLLAFAFQVAQGMAHIAKSNIVHRDLACRNVLVGYNRVCKVGDLGLARRLNNDGVYIRIKQEKLPVKWLPIETIKYRRSTLRSDVWSYGIALWEIVTIGGMPYSEYKSKEIPALIETGYRMPKPDACSDELYEMMIGCWNTEENLRPTFESISKQLEVMRQCLKDYINMEVYDNDASYLLFDGDNDADINDDVFIEAINDHEKKSNLI